MNKIIQGQSKHFDLLHYSHERDFDSSLYRVEVFEEVEDKFVKIKEESPYAEISVFLNSYSDFGLIKHKSMIAINKSFTQKKSGKFVFVVYKDVKDPHKDNKGLFEKIYLEEEVLIQSISQKYVPEVDLEVFTDKVKRYRKAFGDKLFYIPTVVVAAAFDLIKIGG